MNPSNGIIGDADSFDLPDTKVDQDLLDDEKKMARFSKTSEFKRIKEYAESRIQYYQDFLPNGEDVTTAVTPTDWALANSVIREFRMLLRAYENANEVLKDAEKRR
jgi:hypothetical protein